MTDAHVTVNPRSDALFGFEAGGFPFQAAIDHGLKPALGVDIDTSMSGDMFAEMRTAFFQQRSVAQAQRVLSNRAMPAAVTVRAILEAATVNSAACLGLADQIGTLTPASRPTSSQSELTALLFTPRITPSARWCI